MSEPTIYLFVPEHTYWQAKAAAAEAGQSVEAWALALIAGAVVDHPAPTIPGRAG